MWVKTETEHVYLLKISLSRDRKKLQQFITDSEILTVRSHTGWQTSEKLIYKTNGLSVSNINFTWSQIETMSDFWIVQCTVITNKCPRHQSVFHFYKCRKVCIKSRPWSVCCFTCSQMFLNVKLRTDFIFMVNVTFYFLRLWRNGHNLKNKTKEKNETSEIKKKNTFYN